MEYKKIAGFFTPVIRNKYLLTVLIFVVWLMFFDSDALYNRYNNFRMLNDLKKQKEYYKTQMEKDRVQLKELTKDENLEKFAREKYLMKKNGEDIFYIEEE
jgi:cell division protein DivIC